MANIILNIPMVVFDTATLVGAAYSVFSPAFTEECYVIRIINNSNINVLISRDGVVPHEGIQVADTFQGGSFIEGTSYNTGTFSWGKGTKLWIRNAAAAGGAGVGLVYLSGYYR